MAKNAWRLAKALEQLRAQVNALAPKRSKKMDGSIGDAAHSARKSDHNPNAAGVVCAIDVTNDPAGGLDGEKFANALRASADPRLNYVIFNRRIAGAGKGWEWRRYSGASPHDKHVHISVKQDARLYDDAAPWNVGAGLASALAKPKPELLPVPPKADVKPDYNRALDENDPEDKAKIKAAQTGLRNLNYTNVGESDGSWGDKSRGALTEFCRVNGLPYRDPLTLALYWAILDDEAKPAEVSEARRDAPPSKVEEIAPEAKAAKDVGWLATVQKAAMGVYTSVILPAAIYLKENPEYVVGIGVVGVVILLAINVLLTRRAEAAVEITTKAVQAGDRFRSAN